MRNYSEETQKRIEFIQDILGRSGVSGIVYGNSGGKDSALVGILCKMACPDTLGVIMPCSSKRNYNEDTEDALKIATQFDIKTVTVDLTDTKENLVGALPFPIEKGGQADTNIAPRLRMTTLYAIAAAENRLVAGTGNRSEKHMGYFTKWGDGAFDFNVIGDLTVTEIYEFLAHLGCAEFMLQKPPSAGLFDGQTDEQEMGILYKDIDHYLFTGEATEEQKQIIASYHNKSEHKRKPAPVFGG